MSPRADPPELLAAWSSIPEIVTGAVSGLGEEQLDLRADSDGWSIRETVHHLVEAQVVASSIVIAALGSEGCTYDWSWMLPGGSWVQRLGYGSMPLEPSLEALRGLNAFVATVVGRLEGGLRREVHLRDAPDADLRRVSVADVLQQEVDHTHEHLAQVRETRRAHGV